jgi:hypothetical protein
MFPLAKDYQMLALRRKPTLVEVSMITPLRDIDPELGRLEDKRDELNRRAATLLEEIARIATQMRADAEKPSHDAPGAPRVSPAAAAALGGIIETRPPVQPGHADPRHRRIDELRAERDAALEAVEALKSIIADRTVLASWALCREQRPTYDTMVEAVKAGIEATLRAAEAADAHLDRLRQTGASLGKLDIVRSDDLQEELKAAMRRIAARKPIEEP